MEISHYSDKRNHNEKIFTPYKMLHCPDDAVINGFFKSAGYSFFPVF